MPPDVAAVIVNYRTAALTVECLEALPAAAGDLELEVVVVDNASGDDSLARLDGRAAVIPRERNDGFAAGVNAGFAATLAPIVVVFNPDARPEPGAVAHLVEHLRASSRAGLASPRLLGPDGVPRSSAYRRFPGLVALFRELCIPLGYALEHLPALDPYHLPPREYVRGARVAHVCGACMAVRRAAYDDAGGLDEGFFLYLEETEWQRRMASRGWTVELVPEARVQHLGGGGSDLGLVPSEHYAASARRYFSELGGCPTGLVRAVMAAAGTVSWGAAAALATARPGNQQSRRLAVGWRHFARAALTA